MMIIIVIARVIIVRISLVGLVMVLLWPPMKTSGPHWGVQYASRFCRCSYRILSFIAPWDAFAKENLVMFTFMFC